jgi:Putative Actinobacterial Holin-X, holin superfamily III
MANDVQTTAGVGDIHADRADEAGFATTFKGVIDDALELMKQQFIILQVELRSDFRKFLTGLIPLASGIVPLLLGGLMLCFTLVHLIHWATLPAGADPATIPLWASYAIVAAGFLLLGGILLAIGVQRLKTVHPLPEQTAQALEENLQWLMNKTTPK